MKEKIQRWFKILDDGVAHSSAYDSSIRVMKEMVAILDGPEKLTSIERERLQTLERICAGVTQDAIDGGWTVIGMMNYTKGLERKINAIRDQSGVDI